jgi:hypothetical protein
MLILLQIFIHLMTCDNEILVSSFRGGKYSEEDAKAVMTQILNVVAFCHLQGVVHRDLKPEVKHICNFVILLGWYLITYLTMVMFCLLRGSCR